ncbi:SBBP repeat-containing protein [Emticicia sp. C21]|uniref:SBBP repeat-containing protein n=1 Tax=Emticicia sp. C21 TaxID=2302915 RepID=UPI000E355291|nr:SBBP repeat-containing protein [Emticicia sp. C21]RFS17842.1 hypothetical protein D0T08_00935 [Emticicia sp. C21]
MTLLRTTLFLLGFCFLYLSGFSQNVTILPGGITPMQSTTYPRLSYDEIAALTSPQDGDIAYDITFKCMRLYNGTKWVRLVSDQDLNIPSMTGWAAGGTGNDQGLGIATDNSGNVFVTGYFHSSATFGDTIVTSSGGADIFLAKYTSTGTLIWITTAGGSGTDASNDVAVDSNGDVYITGYIEATAHFNGSTLISSGSTDVFIAKYSSTGVFQWVNRGGSTLNDLAFSIAIDSGNNVYITGYCKDLSSFSGTNVTSAGNADVFFAKYNTSGSLQWIQITGGPNDDVGRGICVDISGYVYLTGYTTGATNIANVPFVVGGGTDFFCAKYSPFTSTYVWHGYGLGSGNDSGVGITTDLDGNTYMTGYFSNTFTLAGTVVNSSGSLDVFVAKFNATPMLVWVKTAGGTGSDVGFDIVVDTDGNVFTTGYFAETVSFSNKQVTSAGLNDIFIAKYNSAGVVQWVQSSGNTEIDYGVDLALDADNNIYLSGYFQNTAKFGSKNLISAGGQDVFVTRIKD